MVDTHCYYIAGNEVGCHVIHERHVTVGALAEQMTVDIDLAAVVHAFKVDILAGGIAGRGEVLAIPCNASGKESGATCK